MELPKFMMVEHSEHENDIFILHTEFPRFMVNLVTEDVEWFEDVSAEDENEIGVEMEKLIIAADKFYESEVEKLVD